MAEAKDEDEYIPETDNLRCRFYENQYPELEECVLVNVTDIKEMGAYVTLLEYDHIPGMILLSELSRRRIRSMNKLVRVGRTEIVMVIRVDKEKGYIDLSKSRVDPEDVGKCEERFNKAKSVHSVLRHVAGLKGLKLETLYQQVGWPLYRKYGHAYDAFKLFLSNPDENIFEGLDIDPQIKDDILLYVKRKLSPQPVKIRADIEVHCYTYDGIDAIKEALLAGEEAGTAEAPVKIKLIAPPLFVVTCTTLDKDFGISLLNRAIEVVESTIKAKGGSMEVKMAPKAVSQRDEMELQAMLERMALEQEEGEEDDDGDD